MVEQTEGNRTTLRLHVSPQAAAFLENVRAETGVPKETALTRIVEWYVSLDPKLRLAVLNKDESTKAELLHMALTELVGLPRGEEMPATFDEAIAVAKAGLARVEHIAKIYKRELTERLDTKPKKK